MLLTIFYDAFLGLKSQVESDSEPQPNRHQVLFWKSDDQNVVFNKTDDNGRQDGLDSTWTFV